MKAFRIYTLHGCPFCEQALSLLRTVVSEEVEHIDIGDDPVAISGITALRGKIETPITIVNIGTFKKMIVGNNLGDLSNAVTNFLNFHKVS